ncbi:hypothetical protein K504DRAFT_75266 [Pleomassaria siparia CBS 279.74]|uniref:Uncharacterized protein n=1 Tax=Pleomassaria siparia CBS 279.74 TaxID=1314801 RepID=A0A6G1K0Y4_9PLEO|nr:hypothetical protein K504DRAFT_75266 [Pleomassaria siparia CBS 279.74]
MRICEEKRTRQRDNISPMLPMSPMLQLSYPPPAVPCKRRQIESRDTHARHCGDRVPLPRSFISPPDEAKMRQGSGQAARHSPAPSVPKSERICRYTAVDLLSFIQRPDPSIYLFLHYNLAGCTPGYAPSNRAHLNERLRRVPTPCFRPSCTKVGIY